MLITNQRDTTAVKAIGPLSRRRFGGFRWIFRTIYKWYERGRQREALAYLDRHQLDDVGITPEERDEEIAKPFWR
jgi:uncharacterized protein YjiS (DUF1127 family)